MKLISISKVSKVSEFPRFPTRARENRKAFGFRLGVVAPPGLLPECFNLVATRAAARREDEPASSKGEAQ